MARGQGRGDAKASPGEGETGGAGLGPPSEGRGQGGLRRGWRLWGGGVATADYAAGGQERAGLHGGPRSLPRRLGIGTARERHACALRPVTHSGMDSGSLAAERPKRTPGRQRLLSSGCGVPVRPGVSTLPGGRSWLRPRGRTARASRLLLLLLVPSPRLAATAPRRTLAERSRPGLVIPAAALGAGRNALGRLRLGARRVAALVSSRRELSLSARCHQLEPRKGNLPTSVSRQLYFDTHALVCLLEANGFTIQQAEIIVSALVKITETNMDIIYKDMVSKMQQEIALQQIISKIANVKKDMIILEKSEFSALRAENEKIKLELHQLKQQVMDEVTKVRTDTKLNFNLEKSRVKELYSLNEKKMLELRTEIVSLHAQQDRALTQTDRKIETEVAGLKTMLEAHKLDTIKYLAGSVFTCLTVALGFYRLWI